MPVDTIFAGSQVRRLRQSLDLTQVEMARRLGLSPSYLNLIEHGRRPIPSKVMTRIDQVFEIDLVALGAGDGARIFADLKDVIADPLFGDNAIGEGELRELVTESPAAGRVMIDLYRAYQATRAELGELAEQLHSREFTAGIAYEFRSLVTSIRSAAEILRDNPDLDLDQRRRFVDVILSDSQRLMPLIAGVLNAGAPPPAGAAATERPPADDVADFVQQHSGYFPSLEDAADAVRNGAERTGLGDFERIASRLAHRHRVAIQIVRASSSIRDAAQPSDGECIRVSEMLPPSARLMTLARALVRLESGAALERVVDGVRWATRESREAALNEMTEYLVGAVLMPYGDILASAYEFRHDFDRLQRRFGVGFEQVARRLASLRRPGSAGIPFYIIKADMAGNVRWRFGTSDFRIPRHGGTCPLWNLHAAFLMPGVTRPQLSRLPDGSRFFSIARAVQADEPEIMQSPRFAAIEIGCEVSFARDIVYADALELGEDAGAVPIGPTCRLCERYDCAARALPSLRRPTSD